MPRKVCFVGTTSTGFSAPFDDKTWEIWGVSARAAYLTRADRWYEIHRLDGTFKTPSEADNWRSVLKRQCADVPELRMFYPEPDLHPNVIKPDFHLLEARFGGYHLSSTFAWMWADLLNEEHPGFGKVLGPARQGPGEVMICGVEMEFGTEYSHQRPGMRHFIDLAESHGWKVNRLHGSSFAYEPVPYPFWQDDPLHGKLDKEMARAAKVLAEREEMLAATRDLLTQNRAKQRFLDELNPPDKEALSAALLKEEENLAGTSVNLCRDLSHWGAVKNTYEHMIGWLEP